MIVQATCNVCKQTGKLDVGDRSTREEIEAHLKDRDLGQCPFGNHVELGRFLDYVEIDYSSLEEGEAPTDEEFLRVLHEAGKETFFTDDLQAAGIKITGFTFGFPSATRDGKRIQLDFTACPSGKRVYYMAA